MAALSEFGELSKEVFGSRRPSKCRSGELRRSVTLTGWQQSSTSVLIADGLLEIGDGYRAKNSELGKVGIPFARVRNVQQGFDFRESTCSRSRPSELGQSATAGRVRHLHEGQRGEVAFVKRKRPVRLLPAAFLLAVALARFNRSNSSGIGCRRTSSRTSVHR